MAVKNTVQSATPADTQQEDDVTNSAAASTAVDDRDPGSSPENDQDSETLSDAIEKALSSESENTDAGQEAEEDESTDEETDDEGVPDEKADKPETDGKKEADKEEEDDQGDDLTEGQKVPYARFKKIIDERNRFKEQIEQASTQAGEYKQGHEQYQAITGFMQQNELSHGDVAEALHIAALMNSDPIEAAKLLAPKMSMLQQYTGEILPNDLQEKVDLGELDSQAAQEIVRTRNENARLKRTQDKGDASRKEQDRAARYSNARNAMADAADTVNKEIVAADPEYGLKASLVRDRLSVLINETKPTTPEQAGNLVRRAHKEVSDQLQKALPRKEIKPGPNSTETKTTTKTTEEGPASMAEAIQLAASQST